MAEQKTAAQDFRDRPTMKPVKKLGKADRVRELYRCDPLDSKLCEIIYEHPTVTYPELSALTGITVKQVRWRLEKPAVRKRLNDMHQSKADLIEKAKLIGIRRLMKLVVSEDEWVALQACKVLLHGELATTPLKVPEGGVGVVYEVQIGPQGQVYQTMRQLNAPADPSLNPQGFPTVIDAVTRLKEVPS